MFIKKSFSLLVSTLVYKMVENSTRVKASAAAGRPHSLSVSDYITLAFFSRSFLSLSLVGARARPRHAPPPVPRQTPRAASAGALWARCLEA